jgi:hypothetical protein
MHEGTTERTTKGMDNERSNGQGGEMRSKNQGREEKEEKEKAGKRRKG